MNNIGYIFIVRRLAKQSKLILSRSDSISNLELNLKIHGPRGPNAHAGADLQAFLIFCFKPNLLSAHKLILLIYGDNTGQEGGRASMVPMLRGLVYVILYPLEVGPIIAENGQHRYFAKETLLFLGINPRSYIV